MKFNVQTAGDDGARPEKSLAQGRRRARPLQDADTLLQGSPKLPVGLGIIAIAALLILLATICRYIDYPEHVSLLLRFNVPNVPSSMQATAAQSKNTGSPYAIAYIVLANPKNLKGNRIKVEVEGSPASEFGWLEGRITSVDMNSDRLSQVVRVDFPNATTTTTGAKLHIEPGRLAHGIVTVKVSLLKKTLSSLYSRFGAEP